MRCRKARKILGQEMEGRHSLRDREPISAHLASCAACSEFAGQLGATWELLGAIPQIQASDDFAERVHRSAIAGEREARSQRSLERVRGWQWMALAACALMLGVALAPNMYLEPAPALSSTDHWDESFLQDLDSSLDASEDNYLPVYDAWNEDPVPADKPAIQENAGGGHGKS